MNTAELITLLSKGNEQVFRLSSKQMAWLVSVARNEGLYVETGHGNGYIALPDLRKIEIKAAYRLASGGSYVGRKATGNYSARLHYRIQYTDTNIIEWRDSDQVDSIRRQGYIFNIIP